MVSISFNKNTYYVGDTLDELYNNIITDTYCWSDSLQQNSIWRYKYLLETSKTSLCRGCVAIESLKYPIYRNNFDDELFENTLKPKPILY